VWRVRVLRMVLKDQRRHPTVTSGSGSAGGKAASMTAALADKNSTTVTVQVMQEMAVDLNKDSTQMAVQDPDAVVAAGVVGTVVVSGTAAVVHGTCQK